jgi:hypothetical protein
VKGIVHAARTPYWRFADSRKEHFPVSFFDDDDQPTRTSRTPRPRRAAARAAAGAGGPSDHQQLLIRRAVALGVLVLLLILIVIGFNSCRSNARKTALRDYNQQVATLARESDDQVSKPLFDLLQSNQNRSPVALETQINQYRVVAEDQANRARNLDVPGQMVGAQRHLTTVLDFRAEALARTADQIRAALGSAAAAQTATNEIAGQMQKLLASDVIFSQRVAPLIKQELDANGVTGQTVASSKFLPNLGWLNPGTVAARIGGQGGGAGQPTTPGPHGHGLVSVAAGGVTLQPAPAVNRVAAGTDTTFTVTFQNQGASDENDVKVSIRISGAGNPITVNKTVPQTKAGATSEVQIPLGQSPPIGTPVTVRVLVGKVPGEQKTDNNRQTYTVLFTR